MTEAVQDGVVYFTAKIITGIRFSGGATYITEHLKVKHSFCNDKDDELFNV